MYEHNGLSSKSYSLRVMATVPNTRERAILRGVFRVPDKELCSVTIVNRVEVKGDKAKVDFVGSDSVKEFFCRLDRTKRVECENLLFLLHLYGKVTFFVKSSLSLSLSLSLSFFPQTLEVYTTYNKRATETRNCIHMLGYNTAQ